MISTTMGHTFQWITPIVDRTADLTIAHLHLATWLRPAAVLIRVAGQLIVPTLNGMAGHEVILLPSGWPG